MSAKIPVDSLKSWINEDIRFLARNEDEPLEIKDIKQHAQMIVDNCNSLKEMHNIE